MSFVSVPKAQSQYLQMATQRDTLWEQLNCMLIEQENKKNE